MPPRHHNFPLFIALLLAGCAGTPLPSSPNTVTTLYFGFSKPDGSLVSDADWQHFVDADLARLFPEGFTVLAADGGWQEHGRTVHEPSRVVVIVHRDQPSADAAIEQLRKAYCQRFSQESVLRVDQAVTHVSF